MANAKVTTAWGTASVLDEVTLPQEADGKTFASVVQLLAGAESDDRGRRSDDERHARPDDDPRSHRRMVDATWRGSALLDAFLSCSARTTTSSSAPLPPALERQRRRELRMLRER